METTWIDLFVRQKRGSESKQTLSLDGVTIIHYNSTDCSKLLDSFIEFLIRNYISLIKILISAQLKYTTSWIHNAKTQPTTLSPILSGQLTIFSFSKHFTVQLMTGYEHHRDLWSVATGHSESHQLLPRYWCSLVLPCSQLHGETGWGWTYSAF